ncbi:MAG: hypothetical protein RL375_3917, partial [Pseudomonadota bacterium]
EAVFEAPEPPPALPGAPGMPGKPGAVGQNTKPGAAEDPKPNDKTAALAADVLPQPTPDLIDDLVAEQADQWQPLLGPLIEPLLAEMDKALAAGESLQAFAARLPDLIPKLDAQPITAAIAQAAFAARLAGEADVDLNQE